MRAFVLINVFNKESNILAKAVCYQTQIKDKYNNVHLLITERRNTIKQNERRQSYDRTETG